MRPLLPFWTCVDLPESGVAEIQENKRYFYSIKYEQYNNDEMKNDEM